MLRATVPQRSGRRRLPLAVASLALATFATGVPVRAASGFDRDDTTAVMASTVPETLLAQLLLLADDACDVRYVPGTLDRAAHVETWLRGLATETAHRTRHPARLVGLVLGHEEWQQARLPCPYGIPCRAGTRVVALPAAGDATTVALWQGVLGALPPLSGTPLMGTAEEAASLAPADALALSVTARDLVTAAGFAGDEPWIVDLLAQAMSLDAAQQMGPGRAADVTGFWDTLHRRDGPQGVATSDPLALELRRQARLFFAAQALLGSEGRLPVRTLRKLQEKGGGVLRGADLRATWPAALGALPPKP